MDLQLSGRNCVVLGGSRGIGRAIAQGLAAEGGNVAICARSEGPLREAEAALSRAGARVYAAACDVADPEALARFLDQSRIVLGSVDVLVHNASALATDPSRAAWESSFRVDLLPAVVASEQVIPWMQQAGGGSILFVSSISGLEGYPLPDFGYAATKSALIAYAKKLALIHAPAQIRVNVLAPGSTEFPGGVWATVKEHRPELYQAVHASIPSGRLGTPHEVADAAVFLVSPRANWIRGACVVVDGGQYRGLH
jgi:3-oxoacyl-[acyl-carrier protein] reductase